MHPRLIKLTIPKQTLLSRHDLMPYLDALGRLDAMPERRGDADALRVARSYHRCYEMADPQPVFLGLPFGKDHLFDSDIRRLALALLGDTVSPLWPGVWVALGPTPALDQVANLARLLTTGSLTVQSLMLARSQDNLNFLANELSVQWRQEHAILMARLDKTPPAKEEEVNAVYQRFRRKISNAEEVLGRPILSL